MGKSSLFFITLNLILSTSAFAINWGHLVTGTPEVLPKGQKTVGTVLFGYGITDRLTLGVSPMAFLSYDFYSVISRYQIYSGDNWSVGTDFWYFKSVPELQGVSSFSQENVYIKLNTAYRVFDKLRINISYGYQKFYNEDSPYSLRPDPLGKERVFAIKGEDPYWYEAKLNAFDSEVRSPETHSLTIMPTFYFNEQYYLNLEYGVLGMFYELPLTHVGASINSQTKNWDISLGFSKSSRIDFYGDSEVLTHTEVKLQYNF
ncbi:MAG: hypothetical protein CME64_08870 [Halobacteriovoraceae bacterium]|nr:hypothetical protein [Halobacteriovoraceae bacterium]